jgi:hypothetical protein
MRRLYLAAPLLIVPAFLLAAPAMAQDGGLPPPANPDVWDDDPYADTDETVLAVDRFVSALLDMPVGQIAAAIPEAEISGPNDSMDVRDGDTLRDVLARDDPEFETRLRGGARALTGVIGEMSRNLSTMLPALESWGRRIRRSTED